MWQGDCVVGGGGRGRACGTLVRGQTGGMSPPRLVSKMINALLLIIPSQGTHQSLDIDNRAAGGAGMMRSELVSMAEE